MQHFISYIDPFLRIRPFVFLNKNKPYSPEKIRKIEFFLFEFCNFLKITKKFWLISFYSIFRLTKMLRKKVRRKGTDFIFAMWNLETSFLLWVG